MQRRNSILKKICRVFNCSFNIRTHPENNLTFLLNLAVLFNRKWTNLVGSLIESFQVCQIADQDFLSVEINKVLFF
jgi:hypothetical protein